MKLKEHPFFLLGFFITLFIVWSCAYVLTGDGPCHLYNAKIINSLLFNKSSTYYNTFFVFNSNISPNYTGHFLLACFQLFCNAAITEKFFFTSYLLITIVGWHQLLKTSTNGSSYFIAFSFLFIFTHPLFKGFYNYSLSIASYAWVVYCWFLFFKKSNFYSLFLAILVSLFSLFSHPIGFAFSAFSALVFVSIYSAQLSKPLVSKGNIWRFGAYTICILPMLVYLYFFSTGTDGQPLHFVFNNNWIKYIKMSSFNALTTSETPILFAFGIIINLLFVACLGFRLMVLKGIQLCDAFLVTLIIAWAYYLFFPNNFGCDLMELRVQIIIYINLLLFIAFVPFSKKIMTYLCSVFVIGYLGLSIVRGRVIMRAGDAAEEIITTTQLIDDHTTLLFFSFDHNGADENKREIADANWIFHHAAQYIGVDKDVLVLDNYEAHFSYFPLKWRKKYNPYSPLLCNGEFESETPSATLKTYMDSTSLPIDYIVTWCFADKLRADSTINKTMNQLDNLYDLTTMSPSERVRVYALKK
jgi:hypothetical protein